MKKLLLALILPVSSFAAVGGLPGVSAFDTNNFYWKGTNMQMQPNQKFSSMVLSNGGLNVTAPPGTTSYVYASQMSIESLWEDPRNHGASTNLADNSVAFQATIDTGHNVLVPQGLWKLTNGLVINRDYQEIKGVGARMSELDFNPPTSNTCLTISQGATSSFVNRISDLTIRCTSNAVNKVGIVLNDVRSPSLENIYVYAEGATTNTAAVKIYGRDHGTMRNFHFYSMLPLAIYPNPNNFISFDHWKLENGELVGNSGPTCVYVAPNVYWSQSGFYNTSFELGTNGLTWLDPVSTFTSDGMIFGSQCRWEQGFTAGYSIWIDHVSTNGNNATLGNLTVENSFLDTFRNGVHLRGINQKGVTFNGTRFPQSGVNNLTQWDMDSTVSAALFVGAYSEQNTNANAIICTGMTNAWNVTTVLTTPFAATSLWISTNVVAMPFSVMDTVINGYLQIGAQKFMHDGFAIAPLGMETTDFQLGVQGSRLQMNLYGPSGNQDSRIDSFINGNNGAGTLYLNPGYQVALANTNFVFNGNNGTVVARGFICPNQTNVWTATTTNWTMVIQGGFVTSLTHSP